MATVGGHPRSIKGRGRREALNLHPKAIKPERACGVGKGRMHTCACACGSVEVCDVCAVCACESVCVCACVRACVCVCVYRCVCVCPCMCMSCIQVWTRMHWMHMHMPVVFVCNVQGPPLTHGCPAHPSHMGAQPTPHTWVPSPPLTHGCTAHPSHMGARPTLWVTPPSGCWAELHVQFLLFAAELFAP